jgi:hypothetical protein
MVYRGPRSQTRPTVAALSCCPDFRVTQHLSVPIVAAPDFVHDRAGRHAGVVHGLDDRHRVGIDEQAHALHAFDPGLGQGPLQATLNQRVAFGQRVEQPLLALVAVPREQLPDSHVPTPAKAAFPPRLPIRELVQLALE